MWGDVHLSLRAPVDAARRLRLAMPGRSGSARRTQCTTGRAMRTPIDVFVVALSLLLARPAFGDDVFHRNEAELVLAVVDASSAWRTTPEPPDHIYHMHTQHNATDLLARVRMWQAKPWVASLRLGVELRLGYFVDSLTVTQMHRSNGGVGPLGACRDSPRQAPRHFAFSHSGKQYWK